jgi:hypothetical protein
VLLSQLFSSEDKLLIGRPFVLDGIAYLAMVIQMILRFQYEPRLDGKVVPIEAPP